MVVDGLFSNVSSIAHPRFSEETNYAPPEPCPIESLTIVDFDSPKLIFTEIKPIPNLITFVVNV